MDKYLKANRALWDELTGINYRSDFYRVEAFKGGLNKLRPYEPDEVGPVQSKDLLHLQCHFGLDRRRFLTRCGRAAIVSLNRRLKVSGFSSIRKARALAADVGLEAQFICSDLYAITLESLDVGGPYVGVDGHEK